ncbi:hypothetical protein SDC9_205641 [bioreactor metagenome]|uniref:Uncharacterized protein n=1 Tax=bioreactor metagenome TaxID=1076179 RepID=A0A645J2M3_9ZZZZ
MDFSKKIKEGLRKSFTQVIYLFFLTTQTTNSSPKIAGTVSKPGAVLFVAVVLFSATGVAGVVVTGVSVVAGVPAFTSGFSVLFAT